MIDLQNQYLWILLAAPVVVWLLGVISDWLNLRHQPALPPANMRDVIDEESHKKSITYEGVTTRFGMLEGAFDIVVLVIFWIFGGFGWVDSLAQNFTDNEILRGLIFFGIIAVFSQIISLPWSWYSTFVIEEKFGFNKTTQRTFVMDLIKGTALSVLIGAPILAAVLWIFLRVDNAWLWGWALLTAISLALAYIAPRWILPIFNKFEPMPEGDLRDAIFAVAKNCDFPLGEISLMDGSRRSSKSNAFFTGMGKNKRIALFDTLVEKHSQEEICAILAHEIGHFKKKHIKINLVLGILQSALMFFLLGQFVSLALNGGTTAQQVFDGFGTAPSVYCALTLFFILFRPLGVLLGIPMAWLSRVFEFQADEFAARAMGEVDSMKNALKKLARNNLANLTPHPLEIILGHSHPPIPVRVDALDKITLINDQPQP